MTTTTSDRQLVLNRRNVLLAATGAFCAPGGQTAEAADGPIARTRAGRVQGYLDGPIKVFKNVPYGAPTGGANRWLAARPPIPWNGIRQATSQGDMCPQMHAPGTPMAEEAAMSQAGPMSEDCLNINVYTPAVGPNSGKRPVMVWHHGGAFANGSGGATSYDGRNLAEKQDVVLVTVTPRLNVFGFLYLEELFGPAYADSGNIGILDCVAALRWVRDNISGFGGDPNEVTIFGQSGGAAKVSTMMGMPAARGLFRRVIAESSSAVRSGSRTDAARQARAVVEASGAKTVADLQGFPADRLIAAMTKVGFQAGPIVDGRNLPAHVFDPMATPISADIPLLTGTNETEITFLPGTPLDALEDAALHMRVKALFRCADHDADRLIELFRTRYPSRDNTYLFQLIGSQASSFQEGVTLEAERKADQGGAPVYVYYFTHTIPARHGTLRSPHTGEIPYVFDSLAHAAPLVGPVTAREQLLADRISASWAAFARTGDPNHPGIPPWPAYDTRARSTMVIDDEFKIVGDPLRTTRIAISELKQKLLSGGQI
jgi:para-nitrobenzyl esterase